MTHAARGHTRIVQEHRPETVIILAIYARNRQLRLRRLRHSGLIVFIISYISIKPLLKELFCTIY